VKKSQTNIIDKVLTGSEEISDIENNEKTSLNSVDSMFKDIVDNKDINEEDAVSMLMEALLNTSMFEEELTKMAASPIMMLMPEGENKQFYLFSPSLSTYRFVKAPVEVIPIDGISDEAETLCLINNIVYSIPNKNIVDVGWN